ncbi:hypothetical protein Tsubulata_009883 [Turnera subulata]|uniref:Reverse transcriptase zinc-binding domain-containing protein n=1 Tax=Turnera subulata TaxID=218843 RepID=A0A9Q0G465_9ROSI|nr:hypothetical protein Tsubulata_009883 [Turnera subulata]
MQASRLPAAICAKIEKVCRKFIWGDKDDGRKVHLINWKTVCQPRGCGGVGLKKMGAMNQAFLMKLCWNLFHHRDKFWARILYHKYGVSFGLIPTLPHKRSASFLWRAISEVWPRFLNGVLWRIGNGTGISFWFDKWGGCERALAFLVHKEIPSILVGATVAEMVTASGQWDWAKFQELLPTGSLMKIAAMLTPHEGLGADRIAWAGTTNGEFSVSSAYELNPFLLPSLGIDPDLAMALPSKYNLTTPANC